MKTYAGLVAGLVLGALATVGGISITTRKPVVVHAQSTGCDASSLKGAYGYRVNGTAYDSQYYTYLFGAVGRLTFDGAGALTGTDTLSADGQILRGRTITGTYTMNSDCTGSVVLTNSSLTMNFDVVSVNNGSEWDLVQTDSSFILTGVMKQQNPVITPVTPATPVTQ